MSRILYQILVLLCLQTYDHIHATTESDPATSKPQVRMVEEQHASKESEADPSLRPHIKTVSNQHITQESEPESNSRPHIRSYDNVHVNKPSDAPEHDGIPRLKTGVMQSTTESRPMEWKIKKQNMFGHASQLSNSYNIAVPKLKKSQTMSATKESDWSTDFSIKSRIRINRKQTANTESENAQIDIPRIKMSDKMSATKESEYIDYEEMRLQMFKERNVHGHATDSTVQRLLYEGKFGETSKDIDSDRELHIMLFVRKN